MRAEEGLEERMEGRAGHKKGSMGWQWIRAKSNCIHVWKFHNETH